MRRTSTSCAFSSSVRFRLQQVQIAGKQEGIFQLNTRAASATETLAELGRMITAATFCDSHGNVRSKTPKLNGKTEDLRTRKPLRDAIHIQRKLVSFTPDIQILK